MLNCRNVPDEQAKVEAFAKSVNVPILATIPRSDEINICEDLGQTVLEGTANSDIANLFLTLASNLQKLTKR